ncbi:oligosaccharyltransferase complex subunit OSTC-like [Cervus canadensis]|uniref:oligosaccharyltransferase complex subunit OSTC-like n=1 Tax=Cervus canadensis TaxID=1574408 RepID=UPI001C9E8B17|nr:oligosaccharyltransferase complex subunit OSTC-like [Cervus canadensis]
MESLYRVPFLVLESLNLTLKKPPLVHMPLAVMVYALVVVSYFLITGGIIYDVTVEPPSVGSVTDEHGCQRPVTFLA